MTKSRARGTAAETGVARFLAENGFPLTERRRLKGARDQGDLITIPELVVEVKGGDAAKNASPALIAMWLLETETERQNAGADFGILVIQRRGVSAARAGAWRAILPDWAWSSLHGAQVERCAAPSAPVEVSLAHAAEQLRRAGYGEPLAKDEPVTIGGAA